MLCVPRPLLVSCPFLFSAWSHAVTAARNIIEPCGQRRLHVHFAPPSASGSVYRHLSSIAHRAAEPVEDHASSAVAAPVPPPSPPPDVIHLRGLVFHGRHGVYAAERELGQKFVVDVRLSLPLTRAALSGSLADSVDYGAVYGAVRRVVEGEHCTLLEELAWRVIAAVMAEWPAVEAVQVRVKKPQVAVEGVVEYLGVEMQRSRAQWQSETGRIKQRKRKKDITQLSIE